MLAVDQPLEKQPYMQTMQWYWNSVRPAQSYTNTVNVHNKTSAVCFLSRSHFLTHSLTHWAGARAEGERWKKNLLYLGAVERNAREIENGHFFLSYRGESIKVIQREMLPGWLCPSPASPWQQWMLLLLSLSLARLPLILLELTWWQNEQGQQNQIKSNDLIELNEPISWTTQLNNAWSISVAHVLESLLCHVLLKPTFPFFLENYGIWL